MSKRPNLLANIDMETAVQKPKGAPSKVVEMQSPAKASKPKPVQNTIYLPRNVHRLLKEIALARNCKVHDLFIEGVDHVLTSKGHPSVEELGKE